MNLLLTSALLMVASLGYIDAHGEMIIPPNRGYVWRFDRSFPRMDWSQEWCDFEGRVNPRNASCGICGPIYNGNPSVNSVILKGGKPASVPSMEVEGSIYTGIPVLNYTMGQTINIKIWHQAVHGGGPHSFHLCEASYKKDPTQACLDANPLRFAPSKKTEQLIDPEEAVREKVTPNNFEGNLYNYRVTLPKQLTCEHCVLQWKWTSVDGAQIYRSCADIGIY